jgi:hypothetical protein
LEVDAKLRYLGLVLLAGAAWFVLAAELGWIDRQVVEVWFAPLAWAGAAAIAFGFALKMFSGVGRRMQLYRCARCGAPTGRGETYCRDHMQQTVNEYQDEMRRRTARH